MLLLPLWLERRLELAAAPVITGSFWLLAVLVCIKIQEPLVKALVLGGILACCLLLIFVNIRHWRQSLGTPGVLLIAAITSYLVIGALVSLFGSAELRARDVLHQAFFLLVTLAAILGGRQLLERVGIEGLVKGLVIILMVICAVVAASPLLEDIGLLPESRLGRATGTFTGSYDAGFIGCITLGLALALLYRGRLLRLAYPALALGYAAIFLSISYTSMLTAVVITGIFLLLNVGRLRSVLLPTGVALVMVAVTLLYVVITVPSFTGTSLKPTARVETALSTTQLGQIKEMTREARGDKGNTLRRRTVLWQLGAEKAWASPLVGNGLYQMRTLEGSFLNPEGIPIGVHNIYLLLLGEAGIIPLALFLLALFALARVLMIRSGLLARDVIIAWMVIMALFAMLFHHLLTNGVYNFFAGLSCAMAAFLAQEQSKQALS